MGCANASRYRNGLPGAHTVERGSTIPAADWEAAFCGNAPEPMRHLPVVRSSFRIPSTPIGGGEAVLIHPKRHTMEKVISNLGQSRFTPSESRPAALVRSGCGFSLPNETRIADELVA
jgi:hypothetical protein